MTTNSTILQKGLILVGIPLLGQMFFLGVLVKIRHDQTEAQKWALHTGTVIADAEKLYTRISETHSAMRGYALTADPFFLKKYDEHWRETYQRLDALRELVRDNPPQQAALDEVRATLADLAGWQKELRARIEGGNTTETKQFIQEGQGLAALTRLRTGFDAFLATEEQLNTERLNALDRQAAHQNWALYVGGLLALASTGLLGFLFTRSIARRLTVLTENARRLGEGRPLLAPLAGKDELGVLDRAFRHMADVLDHKNRENEMFVYSVSHDLRSPLVNLQGFSQELSLSCQDLNKLLGDSADIPAPVRQRACHIIDGGIGEATRFIQTAVTRLSGIIDSLLRLSRAGRVEYRMQAVETAPLVRRIVASLHNTLAQKNAAVAVGDLPVVWGDPVAVEQILANLIANAAHYLDPQRPGRIEVGTVPAPTPDQRVLSVRDNGLGIAAEHQGKIFLAFQRLHPHNSTGEGIGLSLVRRIVERHAGRIWFESAAGVGTTFFVALPAPAAVPAP